MTTDWNAKQKKDLTAKTINTMLMTFCKDAIPTEQKALEIVELSFKMVEHLEALCGDGLMGTKESSTAIDLDVSNELNI